MKIKILIVQLFVLVQIFVVDVVEIVGVGFKFIVCNCFDGEGLDQFGFYEIEMVVCRIGFEICYQLVLSGLVFDVQVEEFDQLLE